MRSNLFWLNDEQWRRIEPHLPTDVRGKDRVDDRRVISGILHVLKSGCRWCDCPPQYGPPTTIYDRFVRWARRGVLGDLFRALADRGRSSDTQMIDSTHLQAQRYASGGWPRAETGSHESSSHQSAASRLSSGGFYESGPQYTSGKRSCSKGASPFSPSPSVHRVGIPLNRASAGM